MTENAYNKRPLWQWIAIYVIVGIVVYGLIYYIFFRKQNPYSSQTYSGQQNQQTQATQPVRETQKTQQTENSVYKMTAKDKLGTVMTDLNGITLYTYAKDTNGTSNCSGKCLEVWPSYTAQAGNGNFPENISVIKRGDGTLQYAWKGMPLYYYQKDKDSGDAYGDGVGGVWSVVK